MTERVRINIEVHKMCITLRTVREVIGNLE